MPDKPNLSNRFSLRAQLYNDAVDAQARRLAAATDQPPANAQDMAKQPDRLAKAWNFSPSPQPEQDFWQLHDQVLAQNMGQLGTDATPQEIVAAHNDAETKALNQIYPYRAELTGIGTRVIDDQIAQADRIKRIVEGRTDDPTPDPSTQPASGGQP